MSISRLMQKAASDVIPTPRSLNELPSGGETHVVLVDNNSNVKVYDVTDPYNPVLKDFGNFDCLDVRRTDFDPVYNILFIPDYEDSTPFYLQSVNVNNPNSIFRADGITNRPGASENEIFQRSTDVAVDYTNRVLYNVLYFAARLEEYSYSTSGALSSRSDTFSSGESRSNVVSVVNPSNIILLDRNIVNTNMTDSGVDLPSVDGDYGLHRGAISKSGNIIYIIDNSYDSLASYSIPSAGSVSLLDFINSSEVLGQVSSIDLDDNNDIVITAGSYGTLAVFDVSNVSTTGMTLKGFITDPDNISDNTTDVSVDSTRGLAYVTTTGGFSVYDLEFNQGQEPIFMSKTLVSGNWTNTYTDIYAYTP